jgi:hypothetical protein
VTRPALKEAAEYAITDRTEALPPSPADQQIRLAEYKAIYEEPQLSIRYGYRALSCDAPDPYRSQEWAGEARRGGRE